MSVEMRQELAFKNCTPCTALTHGNVLLCLDTGLPELCEEALGLVSSPAGHFLNDKEVPLVLHIYRHAALHGQVPTGPCVQDPVLPGRRVAPTVLVRLQ